MLLNVLWDSREQIKLNLEQKDKVQIIMFMLHFITILVSTCFPAPTGDMIPAYLSHCRSCTLLSQYYFGVRNTINQVNLYVQNILGQWFFWIDISLKVHGLENRLNKYMTDKLDGCKSCSQFQIQSWINCLPRYICAYTEWLWSGLL